MVVILGYFYFGQDERLADEAAVLRAVDNATDWLLASSWRHVLVEVNNECNVRYEHAILQPERVHELIERVKARTNGPVYRETTLRGQRPLAAPLMAASMALILARAIISRASARSSPASHLNIKDSPCARDATDILKL